MSSLVQATSSIMKMVDVTKTRQQIMGRFKPQIVVFDLTPLDPLIALAGGSAGVALSADGCSDRSSELSMVLAGFVCLSVAWTSSRDRCGAGCSIGARDKISRVSSTPRKMLESTVISFVSGTGAEALANISKIKATTLNKATSMLEIAKPKDGMSKKPQSTVPSAPPARFQLYRREIRRPGKSSSVISQNLAAQLIVVPMSRHGKVRSMNKKIACKFAATRAAAPGFISC